MEPLEKLAAFASNLKFDELPEEVIGAAEMCILDTISAAVGAKDDRQLCSVTETFLSAEPCTGDADLWGTGRKTSVLRAAYLNAMAGHTLELDDVHVRSKTHIGTVVIPAAWAMIQKYGGNGKTLLTAVIAGYEVMSRIGMGFGVSSHRKRGWHVTATAGTFGAAAAAASVLGLSEKETSYALALAGSQSFGLWAFLGDGASNKVLNPAHAAMSGMEAALLAKAGMTGPVHILDASDGGLYPAMSDASDLSLVDQDLGTVWEILALDKKPYPCCRSTHCAIDAARKLRETDGFSVEQVNKITVETYEVGYRQCGASETSREPVLPVHARFSTSYTVARALLDGTVGLGSFQEDQIADEAARGLMHRVTVVPEEGFTARYPEHWGCRLTAELSDGRVLTEEIPDASGSVSSPMTRYEVIKKASLLAEDAVTRKLLDLRNAEILPVL